MISIIKYVLVLLPLISCIVFLITERFLYQKLAPKQCLFLDISLRAAIFALTIIAEILLVAYFDVAADDYFSIMWIPCILFLIKKTMIKW